MSDALPFTIRAHHLELLMNAEAPSTPLETTTRLITDIKGMRGDATSDTVTLAENAKDMDLRAYGVDTLGDTDTQAQTYEDGVLTTLTRFQQLPDDAPVTFGAGILDSICNGCAFKVHCGRPAEKERDLAILAGIEEAATEIGQLDRIHMSTPENDPASRQFDTDAGTVRAVMLCFRYGYVTDADGTTSPATAPLS